MAEICPASMKSLARMLFSFAFVLALSAGVDAHPFHICVGQMRWNGEEKYWELSLRIHPQDLEQSMQRWRLSQSSNDQLTGQSVAALLAGCRIEDPDFESHAIEFLGQHFFLFLPDPVDRRALGDKRGGPRISLEDQSAIATQNAEARSRLVWVGKEYEKAWVWLHMELHPPQRSIQLQQPDREVRLHLCHKVLLGEISEQENSILVEPGDGQKFSLQFKGDDVAKPLEPDLRSASIPAGVGSSFLESGSNNSAPGK